MVRTRLRSSGAVVTVKLLSRFGDSDHWRFQVEARALKRIVHPSASVSEIVYAHTRKSPIPLGGLASAGARGRGGGDPAWAGQGPREQAERA